MKLLTGLLKTSPILLFFSILSFNLLAQNKISILPSDLTSIKNGITTKTVFEVQNIAIDFEGRRFDGASSSDFFYSGTLSFDLQKAGSIDSVIIDYYHTCNGCFDVTLYTINGDSIFYNRLPVDSILTYKDSAPLSQIKIWGLEAGFEKLNVYGRTLNSPKLDFATSMNITPNPFSQEITITSDLFCSPEINKHPVKLSVNDNFGREIYSTFLKKDNPYHPLNLSFLSDGIYLFTLSTSGKKYYRKIIKH